MRENKYFPINNRKGNNKEIFLSGWEFIGNLQRKANLVNRGRLKLAILPAIYMISSSWNKCFSFLIKFSKNGFKGTDKKLVSIGSRLAFVRFLIVLNDMRARWVERPTCRELTIERGFGLELVTRDRNWQIPRPFLMVRNGHETCRFQWRVPSGYGENSWVHRTCKPCIGCLTRWLRVSYMRQKQTGIAIDFMKYMNLLENCGVTFASTHVLLNFKNIFLVVKIAVRVFTIQFYF